MRLTVVVEYFRQVLARNIQHVCEVIVSSGNDQLAGAVIVNSAKPVDSRDLEIAVLPVYRLHPLILRNRQMIMLGYLAVIFERLLPRGFLISSAERNIADLQQLRRGEESHVCRVVEDGINHASFVDRYDF